MRLKLFLSHHGIWILISIFALWFTTFSVVRHIKANSFLFDLGYYDQLIWQLAHGKPLFSTLLENHPWLDHFSPSIFLLSPIYLFLPSTLVILLTQSILIPLGAYPLYKIALKKLKNNGTALALSFVYLLFWGIHNAISFDFHPLALGAPLLAFIVYFYEQKQMRMFYLFMLLFAGLQENYFIFLAFFGMFLALHYKDYKRGIVISLLSGATFLLLIFIVIPHYFGSSYYYLPSDGAGTFSLSSLVTKFVTPAMKLEVLLYTFLPTAFVSFLSPFHFILFFEEFAGRFLLDNPNWWGLGYHYNAILATLIVLSTIEGLRRIPKRFYSMFSIYFVVVSIVCFIYIQPDTIQIFKPSYWNVSYGNVVREVVAQIPEDASVAAGNNIGAQIAGRNEIYFITNCLDTESTMRTDGKLCHNKTPDYLVADLSTKSNWNNFVYGYDRDIVMKLFTDKVSKGEYEKVLVEEEIYLLKRIKK